MPSQDDANAGQGHLYVALDSLRGVCACMIVLLHFPTFGAISSSAFVTNAFLFVDFFFVLSGFVIAASYGDRLAKGFSIARFMALRLGRIYPLHLFMLLVFLAFEVAFAAGGAGSADRAAFSGVYAPDGLVTSVLLVQTFVGPKFTQWNGPSWSIAVELWTYLVFALLFRFAPRRIVSIALAIAAASCAYLAFLSDEYLNVTHEGAFTRCLFGFSAGVIAYRMRHFVALESGWRATLCEAVAVAVTVAMVIWVGSGPFSLVMPVVFFATIMIFSAQSGAISRLLQLSPFVLVGTLSYSIYMIHSFIEYRTVNVLSVVDRVLGGGLSLVKHKGSHVYIGGGPLFGDIMSVIMLLVVVAIAWASYHLVETRGRRLSRRWLLGEKPGGKAR